MIPVTQPNTRTEMHMRAFVCLTIQSDDGALQAFGVCAPDRAAALANAIVMITNQPAHSSQIVGVLTQEDVTGMTMLLAAGRAGLSALTSIEA